MSNDSEDTKNLNPAQASKIADNKDIVPAEGNAKPDAAAPVSAAEARSEPSPKPSYKFPFKFKGRPDVITKGSQTASDSTKNGTDKPGTKLK